MRFYSNSKFEEHCKLLRDNQIPFRTSSYLDDFTYEIKIDEYALLKDLESGKLKVVLDPKTIEDDEDLIFNLTKDYNNK